MEKNALTLLTLALHANISGTISTIYPTLLFDNHQTILVDCGYPKTLNVFENAMTKAGIPCEQLTTLILTHHDYDHMGIAENLRSKYHLNVVCSEEQAPYILGERPSLRLTQIEKQHHLLSEEEKHHCLLFAKTIAAIPPVQEVTTIKPGQIISVGGGIEVVDTAGHMPGHISLYLPEKKTLIAGDAVVIEKGKLMLASPKYTLDLTRAIKSIYHLMKYDIDKIICYHGGIYRSKTMKKDLQHIITTYQR